MIIPGAGTVTICSAGHLPVLVVGAGQGVRALDCPVNMALGVDVGDVPFEQARAKTPPGATLVLYTDGLIGTPGSDMELGIAELTVPLRQLFADAPGLEKAADRVLAGLLPDPESHNADVTLLLAQLPAA
ncbi:serine/threonine-protein phosphatase [Streptomyces phaeoluteigriseus]|uniref:Serine/threonine-protein phosphatase n=1 Tax=Streptomyces phaeoluteigriseus TaxID=114686 RepID=A0ABY4ZC40_9ACTN|nr:PP2C family protein-serine/threonine phosphatase [Streptomyces phaeoluteigriseus]USQ86536.1 serine/threonine-protein phosphatase [Streptomyces phaeoluteigriseus]